MKLVLYSTDPKTGKKSVTLTMLWVGLLVACFKLIVSGMSFYGTNFSEFGGGEFAAVVGCLAALYWGRKYTDGSDEIQLSKISKTKKKHKEFEGE